MHMFPFEPHAELPLNDIISLTIKSRCNTFQFRMYICPLYMKCFDYRHYFKLIVHFLPMVNYFNISARFNSTISSRGAIHGLSLLGLFVYKYLADTTFIMGSCRVTTDDLVSCMCITISCRIVAFKTYAIGDGDIGVV